MGRHSNNKWAAKKRRKNMVLVTFIATLFCCVITYRKIELKIESAECEKKLEELEKERSVQEERSVEIEEYEVYVQSKQYIEQEARDKLGLVYPDEIIYEAEEN